MKIIDEDLDSDGYKETKSYYKNGVLLYQKKDTTGDKRVDTWVKYSEKTGKVEMMAFDRRNDGRADTWQYFKNDVIYKREWDRNFDGKPDLRIIEEDTRLLEKQYDNDFDGVFEKIIPAPKKRNTF